MTMPLRPALARDRVRHVGDAVALVVAETAAQARDAADLIQVDYEPRSAAVGTRKARPGQPSVGTIIPATFASTGRSATAPPPSAA